MFDGDRPIKPDKKYLEEAQEKYQQTKSNKRVYLKKGEKQILPCFKNKQPKLNRKNNERDDEKTKAQIHEQIKKKNISKFGQWNKSKQIIPEEQKYKKINPKSMTVNYKHKQVRIQTEEYKKPGYVPHKKQPITEDPQKLEYNKMLGFLKSQYEELEEEKASFAKDKQYLKFKRSIADQPPLQIVIEPKVQSRPNFTGIKKSIDLEQCKSEKQNINGQNKATVQEDKPSKQFNYSIEQIYQCSPFTLKQITKYIRIAELDYENNASYRSAFSILENQRNQALVLDSGDKRVSKFPCGWYQSWVPGKYRTAFNEITNYKVSWFSNGDVKQDFQEKVITYYSKKNRVYEINVPGSGALFYFPEIPQLERHTPQGKEIMYADGRLDFMPS